MGVRFLKVTPDNAVEALESFIVDGYQRQYFLESEYYKLKAQHVQQVVIQRRMEELHLLLNEWVQMVLGRLLELYVTPKNHFRFHYSIIHTALSYGENPTFEALMRAYESKLKTLQEFSDFIDSNFQIHYEVTLGDKNANYGEGTQNITPSK